MHVWLFPYYKHTKVKLLYENYKFKANNSAASCMYFKLAESFINTQRGYIIAALATQ